MAAAKKKAPTTTTTCKHDMTVSKDELKGLPSSQAGAGRHKCVNCAYRAGMQSVGNGKFARLMDVASRRLKKLKAVRAAAKAMQKAYDARVGLVYENRDLKLIIIGAQKAFEDGDPRKAEKLLAASKDSFSLKKF